MPSICEVCGKPALGRDAAVLTDKDGTIVGAYHRECYWNKQKEKREKRLEWIKKHGFNVAMSCIECGKLLGYTTYQDDYKGYNKTPLVCIECTK